MRKIFILCVLLASAGKVCSQADTTVPDTSMKTKYLKKSKTQKTVAWVLLGAGTIMTAAGVISGMNGVEDVNFDEAFNGGALIVAGVLVDLASIPFFIAGAKNKKRAMAVTMRNDFVPQLQNNMLARVPVPTVSFVLRF